MLIGALMVLAPGAGANGQGGNPNEDCPAGTVLLAKFNWQGGSYVFEKGEAGVVTIGEGADTTGGTWSSTKLVHTIIIKGSTDTDSVGVNATEGTFSDENIETPSGQTAGISNLQFCGPTSTQPDEPSLTVTKNIASESSEALAQTFLIDVAGTNGDSDTLGDDGFIEIDDASGEYVITETLPATGWEDPQITCGDAVTSTNESDEFVVTVSNVDVDCIVTNTPETPTPTPTPTVPTPEADLRIVKAVEGDAPDGWTATFVGVPGDDLARFQLGEGDETEEFLDITPGVYRVEEIGSIDSELTDIDCVGDGAYEVDGDTVEVTLVNGDDLTCTFTNFYPEQQVLPEEEEPGSITIVKDVDGWEPDTGWNFGFTGSDGIGRFTLSDDDASVTLGPLEAGSYTFTEDGNSETTLMSIACDGEDLVTEGRAVTVDLAEDEEVTCIFTNAFNPAPAAAPDTEVKGDVITRTLPRTGDETRNLAGVGAFMLALGAAMVLGSKRQLASR